MNPLVSIIIPFFNSEKFLAEAIQSVINQSWLNWELLLIDDGSTDSSTQIALDYSQTNADRIFYFEHESHQNKGVCFSRNLGISKARGDFIAFLDSDDIWLREKLQQQIEIMEKIPEAGMVYGPALYWYSWAGQDKVHDRDLLQDLGVESDKLYEPPSLLLLIDPLGKGSSLCPSNILLRKDALKRSGGFEERFDGSYQSHEDQAFGMKIFFREKVFVSEKCWIKYRKHADSSTFITRKEGRNRDSHLYLLQWAGEFFRSNEPKYEATFKALDRALWPYRHPALSYFKEILSSPWRFFKWFALRIFGHEKYHRWRRRLRKLPAANYPLSD